MALLTLGINHQTAPIHIREKAAFTGEQLPSALQQLMSMRSMSEVVVLSTCNRTEIYCAADEEILPRLRSWLHEFHGLEMNSLDAHFYQYTHDKTVLHLLRVAASLDSLVVGEPQILGQLKAAWKLAQQQQTLKKPLNKLFRHAFSTAKNVRSNTSIGANAVSVAFAAVNLAKRIFGDFNQLNALLIGAGNTIELTGRHLVSSGIENITVANRTLSNAKILARKFSGKAITLGDINHHLALSDIVISSTDASEHLLTFEQVASALQIRKRKMMFMLDLAVPRDLDPSISKLEDVFLYSVDDLAHVINDGLKNRQVAASQAEHIVTLQLEEYMVWLKSLDAVAIIQKYRNMAQRHRDDELERAKNMLAAGQSPEDIIDSLAHRLSNKLMHNPSIGIRKLAQSGDNVTLKLIDEQLNKLQCKIIE